MALRNNLGLLFLTTSLLLASLTTAQYDSSPDDYDDSPSPQPEPSSPSIAPLSPQEIEADVSPGPQAQIFAPVQSPSPPSSSSSPSPSPLEQKESIQSPSPSPSSSQGGMDSANSFVDFLSKVPPASKELISPGAGAPFYFYGSEYSPFTAEDEEALKAGVNPNVWEVCESTDSPSLCKSTIGPYVKDGADVQAVLKVAIDVTDKVANEGLALAKSAADGSGNPPELASIINDCRDIYANAVKNFAKAKAAEGDISTMNSMLSAVITEVGDCEDAFAKTGMDSPFAGVSDKLTNMTGNCLSIVSLLS